MVLNLHLTVCRVKFTCMLPFQVVEWLIGVANHLPSEDQCQKSLVAPVDDKAKFDEIMLGRTKCYDVVTKVSVNHCSYVLARVKSTKSLLVGKGLRELTVTLFSIFFNYCNLTVVGKEG